MEVNISHKSDEKASVGMYYTYVLITPTTLVCLLFSTAIPTSLFIKQLFFILVLLYNDSSYLLRYCWIFYST